jgi:hypothetical protein
MSSFTYIIRSNDRVNKDEKSAECHLKLKGLSQQYKYYECEVVYFHISITNLDEMIELRADSALGFMDGIDSNNGFRTCAFTSNNNSIIQSPFKFKVDNFNNRYIKFQLYDSSNNILIESDGTQINIPWILVLNMKGIEK